MQISISGLEQAIAKMEGRTERTLDLRPALTEFGEIIVRKTDDNYRAQTEWGGKPFAELAPSTILARINAIGAANKYTAGSTKKFEAARDALRNSTTAQKNAARAQLVGMGWTRKQAGAIVNFGHAYESDSQGRYKRVGRQLTKGAQTTRSKMLAPGGITILVDTARMRNSNHCEPAEKTFIRWSSVGYLGYHITGTARMPQRNPSPFIVRARSVNLQPDANDTFRRMVTSYVMTGTAQAGG